MHAKIDAGISNRANFEHGSVSGQTYRSAVEVPTGRMSVEDRDALRTVEGAVYVVASYGTPIAWWAPESGWQMPEENYSVTTNKHKGFVRRAAGLDDSVGRPARKR